MKQGSNPIFGLRIVNDKKRDQCHGFHSVTPGWRSKKGDRSLERSSHLVRADRGGGDKKSRCSLYSTVRPHPFPESFQPLFDTLTCKSSYSIFCIFNVFVWEVWLWWLQVRGILFKFMVVKFQLESRSPRRPQDTEGRSPSLHVSEFWSLSWGYHIRL